MRGKFQISGSRTTSVVYYEIGDHRITGRHRSIENLKAIADYNTVRRLEDELREPASYLPSLRSTQYKTDGLTPEVGLYVGLEDTSHVIHHYNKT